MQKFIKKGTPTCMIWGICLASQIPKTLFSKMNELNWIILSSFPLLLLFSSVRTLQQVSSSPSPYSLLRALLSARSLLRSSQDG